MTNRSSISQWRDRFDDYARSGLSVERWCAARQIPSHRFYYWRRKVSSSATPRDYAGVDWLAVATGDAAPSTLTVRVGGAAIDVASGFDPGLLRSVVAALEAGARC
jgi:hypothetical protein